MDMIAIRNMSRGDYAYKLLEQIVESKDDYYIEAELKELATVLVNLPQDEFLPFVIKATKCGGVTPNKHLNLVFSTVLSIRRDILRRTVERALKGGS